MTRRSTETDICSTHIGIAIVHIVDDIFLKTSRVQMFDFRLGIGDGRWDVLNDHVSKAFEFAEESRTDQTKQWTNVQF